MKMTVCSVSSAETIMSTSSTFRNKNGKSRLTSSRCKMCPGREKAWHRINSRHSQTKERCFTSPRRHDGCHRRHPRKLNILHSAACPRNNTVKMKRQEQAGLLCYSGKKGDRAAYYGQHPFWWSRHQKQLLSKILHDLPKLSLGTFCTHKLIQPSKIQHGQVQAKKKQWTSSSTRQHKGNAH